MLKNTKRRPTTYKGCAIIIGKGDIHCCDYHHGRYGKCWKSLSCRLTFSMRISSSYNENTNASTIQQHIAKMDLHNVDRKITMSHLLVNLQNLQITPYYREQYSNNITELVSLLFLTCSITMCLHIQCMQLPTSI